MKKLLSIVVLPFLLAACGTPAAPTLIAAPTLLMPTPTEIPETATSTPQPHVMSFFELAHYDCVTYIRYSDTDGKRREGCDGMFVEYRYVNGELAIVTRSVVGKEKSTPGHDKISNPMPDSPFWESFMNTRHYWWLPATTKEYTIPSDTTVMDNGDYVSTYSEIKFAPIENATLKINDATYDTVKYAAEFEWISNSDNVNASGIFFHRTYRIRVADYFEAKSGLLIRSEYYRLVTFCDTNDAATWAPCANGSYVGTENVEIFELTNTNLPISK